MPAVKTTTLDALWEAQITGHRLVLPRWLDRQQYKSVDQVLRNLGGAWSRYEKAHVFAYDPSEAIAQVLADGQAPGPPSREEGSVPTPPDLARRILRECTDIGDWDEGIILEPSAGAGALVQAIGEETGWSREVGVVAIEPNGDRAASIPRWQCPVYTGRLEEFLNSSPDLPREFDAVVANPPFSLPSRPTAWIEHTWHAWSLLKPGGRLVSFAPKGLSFRTDRKHRELRGLIERYGGSWIDLETGAFEVSKPSCHSRVFDPTPGSSCMTNRPSSGALISFLPRYMKPGFPSWPRTTDTKLCVHVPETAGAYLARVSDTDNNFNLGLSVLGGSRFGFEWRTSDPLPNQMANSSTGKEESICRDTHTLRRRVKFQTKHLATVHALQATNPGVM